MYHFIVLFHTINRNYRGKQNECTLMNTQQQVYRTTILTSDTTWFNIMNRWPLNKPIKNPTGQILVMGMAAGSNG